MQENTKSPNIGIYNYQPLNQKIRFTELWNLLKNDLANKAVYLILAILIFGVYVFFSVGAILFIILVPNLETTIIFMFLFFIVSFFVYGFMFVYSYCRKLVTSYKMSQFAKANNIGFITKHDSSLHNGLIFGKGHSNIINYAYIFNNYNLQMGSYSYTIDYGKNRKTFTYGYIVFDLPRNVPHMFLDSKSNNFMGLFSSLPTSFSGDQKLALEGDFNKYFTLYAPKEYEKDALYIFTPDVMQAVIQYTDAYDIEIISNKLYIYNQKEFNLTDQNNLKQLLKIIGTLTNQFYDQTHYYADETVGSRAANIVNTKGRHLSKSYMSYLPTILSVILSFVSVFIWLYFVR